MLFRHLSSATRLLKARPTCATALSRHFSTAPPAPPPPLPIRPPFSLTKEMAVGIQNATELFIHHGVGMQRLQDIAKESGDSKTLVHRWQRMMEAYLGTQVHVLSGVGYQPNESGLRE